jgi:hypothetical protein
MQSGAYEGRRHGRRGVMLKHESLAQLAWLSSRRSDFPK